MTSLLALALSAKLSLYTHQDLLSFWYFPLCVRQVPSFCFLISDALMDQRKWETKIGINKSCALIFTLYYFINIWLLYFASYATGSHLWSIRKGTLQYSE